MATRDRLNLFPSRANFVFVKQRMMSAQKGLVLLKRKRDALELKLREFKSELNKHRDVCDQTIRDANFSMARLNYLGTDLKPHSMLTVSRADVFLRFSYLKTIGVSIPQFDISLRQPQSFPLTGLSRGGIEVEKVRAIFQEALKTISAMASADYSVKVLETAVHSNNMRLNGLELVVIPRFQNTLTYIRDEMDEFEREDFYRLKRGQAKRMERLRHDIAIMRNKIDDPEKFLEETKEKQEERNKNRPDWKAIFKKKYQDAQKARQELLKLMKEMEEVEEENDTEIGYDIDGEFAGEYEEEDNDFYYTEGLEGEVELKQRALPQAFGEKNGNVTQAENTDLTSSREIPRTTDPSSTEPTVNTAEVSTHNKAVAESFSSHKRIEPESQNLTHNAESAQVVEENSRIHSDAYDDSGSSSNEEVMQNTAMLNESHTKNSGTRNKELEQVQNSENSEQVEPRN